MSANLVIILLALNLIKSQTAPIDSKVPSKAIAIIRGEIDGNTIEGTIKFTQIV
jgi:hypothetical protein